MLIKKSYKCMVDIFGQYTVHAWHFAGTDTVSYRVEDRYGFGPVESEKLSRWPEEIRTMDDIIDALYYVVLPELVA